MFQIQPNTIPAITIRLLCYLCMVVFLGSMVLSLVFRHGFAFGSVILQDLISYSFAGLVVLSVAVAQFSDRHVRCDVNAGEFSDKVKQHLFRFENAFFLIPPFILIALFGLPDIITSWKLFEGSPEPDGLGGYFLIKSTLLILCLAMIYDGFTRLTKNPE